MRNTYVKSGWFYKKSNGQSGYELVMEVPEICVEQQISFPVFTIIRVSFIFSMIRL